ncbi:uncharacterized protein LOC123509407 [Portunus trituberculatus]|uniref:uncharacterized protein LOC123509407 n=1 Tax=Portunus trituberculatus TaxID=210409 RepID=UPI001E1CF8E1|nr:uncharacterized protein LOC123509407 [Portunus trituberculatus]
MVSKWQLVALAVVVVVVVAVEKAEANHLGRNMKLSEVAEATGALSSPFVEVKGYSRSSDVKGATGQQKKGARDFFKKVWNLVKVVFGTFSRSGELDISDSDIERALDEAEFEDLVQKEIEMEPLESIAKKERTQKNGEVIIRGIDTKG